MKKTSTIKIGKTIQTIRKSNGYTQEKLAEAIDCSARYISDIEQDKSKPSYENLIKICNVFNLGLDDIFSEYLRVWCEETQEQYDFYAYNDESFIEEIKKCEEK